MSEEKKMVTEREAVERERKAFQIGWFRDCLFDDAFGEDSGAARKAAERRYPFPKITRPRILRDDFEFGGVEFMVRCGEIVQRDIGHHEWTYPSGWSFNTTVISAWADLLANPTEEVDA